jgi:hypothetical protein
LTQRTSIDISINSQLKLHGARFNHPRGAPFLILLPSPVRPRLLNWLATNIWYTDNKNRHQTSSRDAAARTRPAPAATRRRAPSSEEETPGKQARKNLRRTRMYLWEARRGLAVGRSSVADQMQGRPRGGRGGERGEKVPIAWRPRGARACRGRRSPTCRRRMSTWVQGRVCVSRCVNSGWIYKQFSISCLIPLFFIKFFG